MYIKPLYILLIWALLLLHKFLLIILNNMLLLCLLTFYCCCLFSNFSKRLRFVCLIKSKVNRKNRFGSTLNRTRTRCQRFLCFYCYFSASKIRLFSVQYPFIFFAHKIIPRKFNSENTRCTVDIFSFMGQELPKKLFIL